MSNAGKLKKKEAAQSKDSNKKDVLNRKEEANHAERKTFKGKKAEKAKITADRKVEANQIVQQKEDAKLVKPKRGTEMCLSFFDKTKGWCNMKNRIIILAFFVSQFLFGCIAFIPPSHRESNRETVVIIREPGPIIINDPIIIEVPVIPPPQKPEKPADGKYRKHDDKRSSDREQNSGRDTNERIRNSGERNRR